jgi:hypothetical protein
VSPPPAPFLPPPLLSPPSHIPVHIEGVRARTRVCVRAVQGGESACFPVSDIVTAGIDGVDGLNPDLIISVPLHTYKVSIVLADGSKRELASKLSRVR